MDPRHTRAVLGGGAVIVLCAAGAVAWNMASTPTMAESIAAQAARARGGPGTTVGAPDTAPRIAMLSVFVSGAVARPGVYQLPKGSRVADAIYAAGGLLPDADPDKLPNLAGRLTDGKQVKVARLKAGSRSSAAARLDINSATVQELTAIPGMDQATAAAIVYERENYGPFSTLAELHTVMGLDTAVVAALRPFLRIGS